jgi:hypothetical protein
MSTLTQNVKEKFSVGLHEAQEFLVKTPSMVYLSVISGVALQLIKTRLSLPAYGILIGCTLSRTTLIILSKFQIKILGPIIDKTNQFHDKFAVISIILLVAATILAWFIPPAGFAIGIVIGIYYGPIAERKRIQCHQITSNNTDATAGI